MGNLVRGIALFAAIGAVIYAGGFSAIAPAQDKQKKGDKDKKSVKAKAENLSVTEIYKAKDGWRFRVRSGEGKTIAISVLGYETKEEARKTFDLVKATIASGKVEVLKE